MFTNGENLTAKTPLGDFQVTTPETPLLSQQAVISKGIPTKKVVGCKVLQFIHTMKIKKMFGHKTLRCTYTTTSSREWWIRAKLCLWLQIAWTEFAQCLCNLWTLWRPLKQSFYMSRVRRKEGPKTHLRIPRKTDQKFCFSKPWQIEVVEHLSR